MFDEIRYRIKALVFAAVKGDQARGPRLGLSRQVILKKLCLHKQLLKSNKLDLLDNWLCMEI